MDSELSGITLINDTKYFPRIFANCSGMVCFYLLTHFKRQKK